MRSGYNRKKSFAIPSDAQQIRGGDFPGTIRLAQYASSFLAIKQPPLGRYLLEIIFSVLSIDHVFELVQYLEQCVSEKDIIQRLKEQISEAEDPDDLGRAFSQCIGLPGSKQSFLLAQELRPLMERYMIPNAAAYDRRVNQLRRKLDLSGEEIAILEMACCYKLNSGLERLADTYDMTRKAGLIAFLSGIPCGKVNRLISSKGTLAINELLKIEERNMVLEYSVFEYLIGMAGRDYSADAFIVASPAAINFKAFELKSVQRTALCGLVQSDGPAHILFHGKPGTGKTELSKALAEHCGRPAVFVSYGDDGDGRDRKTALLATVNSVPKDHIVIVDEVDGLLNTRRFFGEARVNKGWINNFLDGSRHKIIWICNEIGGMEESVRRRFAYNLAFSQLNWRQREGIWLLQLRKCRIKRFFSAKEIQELSRRFPASPGLIAFAAATLARCRSSDMHIQDIHSMLEELLTRQMELVEGERPKKQLNDKTAHYDLSALNADTDPQRLIHGLESWQTSTSSCGINLLFWGWPGTGKTEFAKYVAEKLGKELWVKRMSDLQSMFVGQTEKQIARAFREAEENDAILFLDEADSLFIDRQTANRSWESSQTNEVLTQMENFKGILICCTNLLDHLDGAAMRRFAFKIKFLPLTPDGILRLYCQYFDAVAGALTPQLESRLTAIRNLCPGDIKAVWQRTQFMGGTVSHNEMIGELDKEVGYKRGLQKQPIGF